ncbi:beta-1,4-galactosyltransferase 2 [Armigeres subalbatus]|uniref:beta-1,4-galactosyltransferase 2 n=1 Tax=Armigeres subalbatus TaxID=124917 RepID=UPI002ED49835
MVMFRISQRQVVAFVACLVGLVYLLWPGRFASRYEYIEGEEIYDHLVRKTTKNVSLMRNGIRCDYSDVLEENVYLYRRPFTEEIINNNVRLGGEWYPEDCLPSFSTAIIIPYRQRENQLNQFLIYMHNYLRRQRIHYRIFVIEQYDPKPFNRAKLFNIGSLIAMKLDYPCLVLHDVDLMPLQLGHVYACSQLPRHMCSSLDAFRYNLPYRGLFGGVVGIQSHQFMKVNGMSNMFSGWGGEDDDFFARLKNKEIDICRFSPEYSRYTMLKHRKEAPNKDRVAFLRNGHLRYHTDGLNSLVYKEVGFKMHNLFTHVLVET